MTDPTGPLISPNDLREVLASHPPAVVRVVDVRWYLDGRKGSEAYAQGHVPGAVFADLDVDLAARPGPGRHPVPPPGLFAAAMGRLGVGMGTLVVAYDDVGGSIAARLWWLLRYYGHTRVAVLDGGIGGWVADGGALTTEVPVVVPAVFNPAAGGRQVVDVREVDRIRGSSAVTLLDARSPQRYAGEMEPVDARPGHIPGARNAPWAGNLVEGRFLSPAALRARYEALGVTAGTAVVCYCGSGVTACHTLLALELAGYPGGRLYEGSWSDWSRDPSLPAALGHTRG